MANEGPGASAVGGDMAAEEMADLRSELSEMRNTNQELREAKMELQVELRQYRADDRVRERDLNQLLLLSSVSPWSCASPVAIPSRADPAVMSSGGATADGSSGHAYGMFNTTYGRAEPLDSRLSPRSRKVQLLNLMFPLVFTAFVHVDVYCFQKYFVCVCFRSRAQNTAIFQDPGITPAGTLTRQTLRSKRADVRRVLLSALFSLEIRYSRVKRRATVCKPLCIKFLRAFFTTACTLPRNGTYGSTLHRVP